MLTSKVLLEKDGRIGRMLLNRPDLMNAIDDDLRSEQAAAVADTDSNIQFMVLSGNGEAFCAG